MINYFQITDQLQIKIDLNLVLGKLKEEVLRSNIIL